MQSIRKITRHRTLINILFNTGTEQNNSIPDRNERREETFCIAKIQWNRWKAVFFCRAERALGFELIKWPKQTIQTNEKIFSLYLISVCPTFELIRSIRYDFSSYQRLKSSQESHNYFIFNDFMQLQWALFLWLKVATVIEKWTCMYHIPNLLIAEFIGKKITSEYNLLQPSSREQNCLLPVNICMIY